MQNTLHAVLSLNASSSYIQVTQSLSGTHTFKTLININKNDKKLVLKIFFHSYSCAFTQLHVTAGVMSLSLRSDSFTNLRLRLR